MNSSGLCSRLATAGWLVRGARGQGFSSEKFSRQPNTERGAVHGRGRGANPEGSPDGLGRAAIAGVGFSVALGRRRAVRRSPARNDTGVKRDAGVRGRGGSKDGLGSGREQEGLAGAVLWLRARAAALAGLRITGISRRACSAGRPCAAEGGLPTMGVALSGPLAVRLGYDQALLAAVAEVLARAVMRRHRRRHRPRLTPLRRSRGPASGWAPRRQRATYGPPGGVTHLARAMRPGGRRGCQR